MTNLEINAHVGQASAPARAPRYTIDLQIAVTCPSLAAPLRGHAYDISVDGMGATMVGVLPAGQEVTVNCVLPLVHQALRARARVSYREGFRHGFEFVGLEAEEREAIRRMSEHLHEAV